MTTSDPSPAPRPPKLGPRKQSQSTTAGSAATPQRKQSGNVTLQRKSSQTPTIQSQRKPSQTPENKSTAPETKSAAAPAGDSKPRPPKLGPRKTSSQTSSAAKLPPQRSSDAPMTQQAERQKSTAAPSKENIPPVPEEPTQPSDDAPPSKPKPKGVPKLGPRKASAAPDKQNQNSAPSETKPDSQGRTRRETASAAANNKPQEDSGESLTTILDTRQRTQLTILLAAATATMRDNLSATFEAEPGDDRTEDEKIMAVEVDPGTADVAARDKQRKAFEQRRKEVSAKPMKKLRSEAEDWFDAWREGVIGRVGEVVSNSRKAKNNIGSKEAEGAKPDSKVQQPETTTINVESGQKEAKEENTGVNEEAENTLTELYPAVRTPLAKLDEDQRLLILHSMLLLLLSMEHYASVSRILLLYVMSSLNLPLHKLKKDEEQTARGLLEAAKELSANDEARARAEESQRTRKWKVGLASVAGAAIVGVTGGMAAPMVAAGVGSMMGGLGLGTTAAAGYLGSVAGSSMLVGSLFGAYGGRMTGQMMDNYAKEVSDFAFIPVHPAKRSLLKSKTKGEDEAGKQDPGNRRLRVTIGISGWLTEKEEVVKPWTVLSQGSEAFALRWELEALMNLGNSMEELVQSAAWGYAQKELISRTIFAELSSAMWPLALVKASRVVDNPFSIAKSRAEKAGQVLADALIRRAQGERPVNLVGYSLGARVIYSCLLKLAEAKAFGLVENVILMGAPLPSQSADWRKMRCVVAGRLVNVFSENDYVLGFLYRTSSVQYGVAGLQKVEGVAGVENVDVSGSVSGHLRYRFVVGSILKKIGFEDIDKNEVEREEKALAEMDAEEAKKASELTKKLPSGQAKGSKKDEGLSEAEAEEEADKMQQNVQDKTQYSLMQKGTELFHFARDTKKAYDDAKGSSYLNYAKRLVPKSPQDKKQKKNESSSSKAEAKQSSKSEAKESEATEDGKRSYLSMASAGWLGSSGKQQAEDTQNDAAKPQEETSGTQEQPEDGDNDNSATTTAEPEHGDEIEAEQVEDDKTDSKKRSYLQMASSSLPSIRGSK